MLNIDQNKMQTVVQEAFDKVSGNRRWETAIVRAKVEIERTNADKRRAVETLLRDDEWAGWSNRELAGRAGVSHLYVANVRRQLADEQLSHAGPARRRARRGGATYPINVASIGRGAAAEDAATRSIRASAFCVSIRLRSRSMIRSTSVFLCRCR